MRRRAFLTLTGLGLAAAASAGAWIRGVRAEEGDEAQSASLSEIVATARKRGAPVLVLLVPEDDDAKRVRGDLFGSLLQLGGDALLADLAIASVVCATGGEVKEATGHDVTDGEPTGSAPMLLLELEDDGVQVVVVDADIGERPSFAWKRGAPPPKNENEVAERKLRAWVAPLASALRAKLAGTAAIRAARAAAVREGLTSDELEQVSASLSGKRRPGAELLGRAAAMFLDADARAVKKGGSPRFVAPLAALSRATIVKQPPPGARWAISAGCGVRVEGGPSAGIRCGMGHVPKPAQRFLWLFVRER